MEPLRFVMEPTSSPVTIWTPIKINLTLQILGKRKDGYHNLQSLVVFAEEGDSLSVEISRKFQLCIFGPYSQQLKEEKNNFVFRAYKLFKSSLPLSQQNARFSLYKNLPIASGLGGGSGNAAAALMLLNQLYHAPLSAKELLKLSAGLGADVPACLAYLLYKKPLYMNGIGEKITLIKSFPALSAVLVNNGAALITKKIFSALNIPPNAVTAKEKLEFENSAQVLDLLRHSGNDLYPAALQHAPQLANIIQNLNQKGALFSGMSGSGATCFGLFSTFTEARRIAQQLKEQHPHYWLKAVELQGA